MTTLVAKIAQASIKVGALATDKRNEQQKYDYISADKILERAGDALAEVGVVVFPSITSEETATVEYTDQYNKPKTRYDCVVHFGMIVSDGETQVELPWVGRGSDYAVPDKACYKAITLGHKYFLAKLLKIGVGNEDGEHEAHDTEAAQDAPDARKTTPTSKRSSDAPKNAPRPTTPVAEDVDFERKPTTTVPTDAEHDIISQWSSPTEAQSWAIMVGACENEHEARHSFKHVVDLHGGKLNKENINAVYLAWVRKVQGKVQQKQAA